MDLQEEYFSRRKVPAHLIRYVDKGNLILRAKGADVEWAWLQVSIDSKTEGNHPINYHFVVSANPVIYASADFSSFSYHHTKVVFEQRWEWDQYESGVAEWAAKFAKKYTAIPSSEAIFVSWQMFLANYDSWLANFLPYRVIDWLANSLAGTDVESRLTSIQDVERWISEKYERVFTCWRNIRQSLDSRNYSDWLANVVNGSVV